jgi:hypothetical protein
MRRKGKLRHYRLLISIDSAFRPHYALAVCGGSEAIVGREPKPKDEWRIETNDRYSRVVSSIISLSTGTLLLPVLFFRNLLGVANEKPILPLLDGRAYAAWVSLGVSILLGLVHSWLSAKWVKLAWGQAIWFSEGTLEFLLDASFVGMAGGFVCGIGLLVWFFSTFHN